MELESDSRVVVGKITFVDVRSPLRCSRKSKMLVVVSICVGLVNLSLESRRVECGGSSGES